MTDPADQLRPITAEEWPRFVRAMRTTFGHDHTGPYMDSPSPMAELDRSLALFDGERVAATAGIYSLEMTVPGAVVPTAGVTWVTVSPTHRRRGVLTAMMRRQLTEVHAAGRDAQGGDTVLIPAGTAHAFKNTGAGSGQLLVTMTPGGLEGFFIEVQARQLHPSTDMPQIAAIAARFNLEFVGPPPA